MQITGFEIDIEKGTLTLTNQHAGTAVYHRCPDSASSNVIHIRYDLLSGWEFLQPLLEAPAFPRELLVYHPAPGQPPQAPFPVVGMWMGVHKYVLSAG